MIVAPDKTKAGHGCPKFPAKYSYRTRELAAYAASKRRRATGEVIKPYACGDHFHMGHSR